MTICHQLKLKTLNRKYCLLVVVDIEERLGESIVTQDNLLNYKYIDESKQIKNS